MVCLFAVFESFFRLFDGFAVMREVTVNEPVLNFGDTNVKYHIEFFRNGFNAIIKLWLKDGCKESPEEMAQILKTEYRGR